MRVSTTTGDKEAGEIDGDREESDKAKVSYELEANVKITSIRQVPDKRACVDLFDNVFVEVLHCYSSPNPHLSNIILLIIF